MRRLPAIACAGAVTVAVLTGAPSTQASGMTLDPTLPAATVSTVVTSDGTAMISLTSPPADQVCVWGIEWDDAVTGEHGYKAGLRPGGVPPAEGLSSPAVCGTGTLPTALTLTSAEVGPGVDSIRIVWTPIANTATQSAYTDIAWPIVAGELAAAQSAVAIEQPDGSIEVDFTDPNPPGAVCVWRWEVRRGGTDTQMASLFGAGTKARDLTDVAPCESTVTIPAALDDPANLDLVLWPEADGGPVTGEPVAIAYVDLPDVDLSAPVTTSGDLAEPSLSLGWWTSQSIAASVPRATVFAPGGVIGTCSYRIQWQAPGVAPRGIWTTGACTGIYIELPQLADGAASGWSDSWTVKAAWAKGNVGAKPKKYSAFRTGAWLTGAELPDATNIQLTDTTSSVAWFINGPAPSACNAQVQLLSTTAPATWSVVSDTYAAPLGLCDDLWSTHPIDTTGAAAIRVRMISSTQAAPAGRWMYAALQRPEDPTDAQVRWNDTGVPVVTFTDPNPPGTVCYWQVSVLPNAVDDITVNPDGSTTCSTSTTFTMSGNTDWATPTNLLIRGSTIPESTAIEGWGPLVGANVAYSPRLTSGKGAAPQAMLTVDEGGYPVVTASGTGCRFVAQWRIAGESLWRTEPPDTSSSCDDAVPLVSAGPTAQRIEARIARATITGETIAHGSWSPTVATIDPMPVPEATFYPGTNRVRVDNQPPSLCGTWFEVRREGTVVLTSLVRGKDVTGALLCGPVATDSRLSTYPPQLGDEVRFAFVRGVENGRVFGPWSPWQTIPSDTGGPVVSVLTPATQSMVKGTVTFDIEATDDVGIDRVEIRLSGMLVASSTTPPVSGDIWRLTWDSTPFGAGYTIATVNVYDTSGNLTSVERQIVLDNPPPLTKAKGKAAKKAKMIAMTQLPEPTIPKAPTVDVPLKKPFTVKLKGKDLAGAAITIRLGISWSTFGTVSQTRTLPALRITVPGTYRVRLDLTNGKTRFVHLRA